MMVNKYDIILFQRFITISIIIQKKLSGTNQMQKVPTFLLLANCPRRPKPPLKDANALVTPLV